MLAGQRRKLEEWFMDAFSYMVGVGVLFEAWLVFIIFKKEQ